MLSATENVIGATRPCDQKVCVLPRGDGVYYAHFRISGQETPVVVLLHGITTDLQAAAALETLTRCQNADRAVLASSH